MHKSILLRLFTAFLLAIVSASCLPKQSLPPDDGKRIKTKAEQAKAGVNEWVEEGRNPSAIVQIMKQVKPAMNKGDFRKGEALLDQALEMLEAGEREYPPAGEQAGKFNNPRKVVIKGYDGDAMEPFISRDNKYLFFNNLNDPKVNTNLHYAKRIDDNTFAYEGLVKGANSKKLDGVASMDKNNNFYFVSGRSYQDSLTTIYQAKFTDGRVSDVKLIGGNVSRKKRGLLNMDLEISGDGETLYFVDNEFDKGRPKSSNIGIAERKGGKFYRLENSDEIMKNINTRELEYAPSISSDGLELYFTRAADIISGHSGGAGLRNYVASRNRTDEPFGKPVLIGTIQGFSEGPSISGSGKSLYFHKKDGERFSIYRIALDWKGG